MPLEISELLIAIAFTAFLYLPLFLVTWLATKHHKIISLKTNFANPRKETVWAVLVVASNALALAVFLFALYQSAGGPIGTSNVFSLQRALLQWGIYVVLFALPVLAAVKIRRQTLETVGITRKNLGFSMMLGLILGFIFALIVWGLSTSMENLLSKLFTSNVFYGFVYFSAVGFGEELMFRGFLQLRCASWLGDTKGWILASITMALIHLPQRIFAIGLDPLQAFGSALSLIPISLALGFLMLRTKNTLGPAVLHTMIDWAYTVL